MGKIALAMADLDEGVIETSANLASVDPKECGVYIGIWRRID